VGRPVPKNPLETNHVPVVEKSEKELESQQAAKARQRAEHQRFHLREAMAERKGPEAFLDWLHKDEPKQE